MTVRYTGSWFRRDLLVIVVFFCMVFGLLVLLTAQGPTGPDLRTITVLWLFALICFLACIAGFLELFRFRLTVGPDTVSYRGVFGERSYSRHQIVRLGWHQSRNGPPPVVQLRFYDADGRALITVDRARLKPTELEAVSTAMGMPIDRPPAR